MTTEILKNGSEHDCNLVDEVVDRLDRLQRQGRRGQSLLAGLRVLSLTNHPGATAIPEGDRAELKQAALLEHDGAPSLLVKDVILSTTHGEGSTFKYTGTPYMNDRPGHKCPVRTAIHNIFPFLKIFEPKDTARQ